MGIVKVLKTVMKDMMGMNSANKKPEKPTMTNDFIKGLYIVNNTRYKALQQS